MFSCSDYKACSLRLGSERLEIWDEDLFIASHTLLTNTHSWFLVVKR